MKKLLFLTAIIISSNVVQAQNSLYVSGNVFNGFGITLAIQLSDSASGVTDTAYALNGFFSDTISVPSSQGILYASIIDCYGDTITETIFYSATTSNYSVSYNFCNFNSSWNNVMACVTVENLSGTFVPVRIQSLLFVDTFYFSGPGTQTICDTISISSSGFTPIQYSLQDCYGVLDQDQDIVFGSTNIVFGNLNYCVPMVPVYVYGNIQGVGGIIVPVSITDVSTGNSITLLADSTGFFEDTLIMAYSNSSALLATIVDCNGYSNSVTVNGSGTFPTFNFNLTYCNYYPNTRQLCLTGLGISPGIIVPVIIHGPSGLIVDTMFFSNVGQTICNTYPVNMSIGNFTIEYSNCDGVPFAQNFHFNPSNSTINGTFNYCNSIPSCYNYWFYDYDILDSTFYIIVDSITLTTAQTFLWSFGDANVSNVANPIHQYSNSGLFEVCLAINTGTSITCQLCRTLDVKLFDNIVVLPQTVGISESEESHISIYPNPAQNEIYIESKRGSEWNKLEIYDTEGKLVKHMVISEQLNRIVISDLQSGMYLFRVFSGSKVYRYKIILE